VKAYCSLDAFKGVAPRLYHNLGKIWGVGDNPPVLVFCEASCSIVIVRMNDGKPMQYLTLSGPF